MGALITSERDLIAAQFRPVEIAVHEILFLDRDGKEVERSEIGES